METTLIARRAKSGNNKIMSDTLSILIIDDNAIRASIIEAGLREAGHAHVRIITEIGDVASQIGVIAPDVVIIDLENPNRDVLEHFFALSRSLKRPIAMFVDGLRKDRVKPILDMAILRFRAFSRMQGELETARSELQGRKVIDKAKAILIQTRGLSEDEAYALLRSTAMNQNRKIAEIAQSLVTAAELLGP
jgi:response regulator NasT